MQNQFLKSCGSWPVLRMSASWAEHSLCAKRVEYALRLNIGAVYRRLGYMLELFDLHTFREIETLRQKLTSSYVILDPMLPVDGKFMARWRLRLNVSPEEIKAVVRTWLMIPQRNISLLSNRLARKGGRRIPEAVLWGTVAWRIQKGIQGRLSGRGDFWATFGYISL